MIRTAWAGFWTRGRGGLADMMTVGMADRWGWSSGGASDRGVRGLAAGTELQAPLSASLVGRRRMNGCRLGFRAVTILLGPGAAVTGLATTRRRGLWVTMIAGSLAGVTGR